MFISHGSQENTFQANKRCCTAIEPGTTSLTRAPDRYRPARLHKYRRSRTTHIRRPITQTYQLSHTLCHYPRRSQPRLMLGFAFHRCMSPAAVRLRRDINHFLSRHANMCLTDRTPPRPLWAHPLSGSTLYDHRSQARMQLIVSLTDTPPHS